MTCYEDELYEYAETLLTQMSERLLLGEHSDAERLAWEREGVLWAGICLRRRIKHADDIEKAVLG